MNIGIIVSMAEELNLLKPSIQNLKTTTSHGITFYCGTIGEHQVTALNCGIGKVNVTIEAITLIDVYHPELVINTGVASRINRKIKVMDIVVGSQVCYHDVWFGGIDNQSSFGQVQGFPLYYDGALNIVSKINENDNLHFGLIVSGDQFVNSMEQIENIRNHFPQALAVDIESGAIAQTCYIRKIPFVSIRVISDYIEIGDDAPQQYKNFCNEACNHTHAVVKELLQKIESTFNMQNKVQFHAPLKVVANDPLCSKDISTIKDAVVVEDEHGLSVCFTYLSGYNTYLPIDKYMHHKPSVGDKVDIKNIRILTIQKGFEEFYVVSW